MNWNEARHIYPNQWLLIEALAFCPNSASRKIAALRVLQTFGDDGKAAWAEFDLRFLQDPFKEIFILHTEVESPDVRVVRQSNK